MKCLDCGNTAAFVHKVEGVQERAYDDDGRFLEVVSDDLETVGLICSDCDSRNVEQR